MTEFSNPRTRAEFDNWPIGSGHVGKCVFEVHHDKRGYRVSRTTTNKAGAWCKPKYTTYANGPACIVDGSDGRTYVLTSSTTYGPSIRVVDSDLQHDVPESRLGHRAYVFAKDDATGRYDALLALIIAGGAVVQALLE